MKTKPIFGGKNLFLVSSLLCSVIIPCLLASTSIATETQQIKESLPEQSPDGLYESVLLTDKTDDLYCYSFLLYPKNKRNEAVQTEEYGRGAELIWSPNHQHFAINHYALSNSSYPIIFKLTKQRPFPTIPGKKSDDDDDLIRPLFWKTFSKNYDLDTSFDHRYLQVLGWLDNDTVLLGAVAHGSAKGHVYVDSYWCLLYSLKTGVMSSNLKEFNDKCKNLPLRTNLPNNNLMRGRKQPSQFFTYTSIIDEKGNIENSPPIITHSIVLPEKEGSAAFTSSGKSRLGGIIRSRFTESSDDHEFYKYLVMNGIDKTATPICYLYESNNDGRFNEKTNISELFIKHVGWKKEDSTEIYALCMIGESTFIVQGIAKDKGGHQTACKTLLYDASNNTFSNDLPQWNDSRVHLFTPSNR